MSPPGNTTRPFEMGSVILNTASQRAEFLRRRTGKLSPNVSENSSSKEFASSGESTSQSNATMVPHRREMP